MWPVRSILHKGRDRTVNNLWRLGPSRRIGDFVLLQLGGRLDRID
jgi:hypothetical protein